MVNISGELILLTHGKVILVGSSQALAIIGVAEYGSTVGECCDPGCGGCVPLGHRTWPPYPNYCCMKSMF